MEILVHSIQQSYIIRPCYSFFLLDIQYKSVFGVCFVFLCRYKHCGVYFVTGVGREKLFFSNCFTSVIDPFLLFISFSIIV